MKDGEYRITMLDCAEGDCFFLEFCFDSTIFTILMDTGPGKCWDSNLKPFLDQLIAQKKKINVLVITHIDSDHIGGAIKLFQHGEYSNLVEEVWFNGLKQVLNMDTYSSTSDNQAAYQFIIAQHRHDDALDGIRPISAKQALSLGRLLTGRGKTARRITCDTPPMIQTDNFRIDFLLPTSNQLNALQNHFLRFLLHAGGDAPILLTPEGEIAFEHLLRDDDIYERTLHNISKTTLNMDQIETWATATADKDSSVTNVSSIAICITLYGKQFLFPGDAAAQDILTAVGEKKLPTSFEVIKLPHHGSSRNCLALPDKLDGRIFLISTDSKKFSHPGKEALAKIVTRPTAQTRYLVFNHPIPLYALFNNSNYENVYRYHSVVSAVIPNEGSGHS